MELEKRITAFVKLGQKLKEIDKAILQELCQGAQSHNNWFTDENVKLALNGIHTFLCEENLSKWTKAYDLGSVQSKTIGVIMAGNIPLVGFHDFLSVLISGHKLQAKLSSQDSFLIQHLSKWLIDIEPEFENQISFTEQLSDFDAIIATGSDNSARYFNQYFAKYSHIIRHNRSSCAVLDGTENAKDISALGKDIFHYYGLGCRNVSKLYVPKDFSFQVFLDQLQEYSTVSNHHKYANNYDYNKSIYLVNGVDHLDTGFLLLKEDQALVSPISVLFYEYYDDKQSLEAQIERSKNEIQCIASRDAWYQGSVPLGSTQQPALWDYADGVDTLAFVSGL